MNKMEGSIYPIIEAAKDPIVSAGTEKQWIKIIFGKLCTYTSKIVMVERLTSDGGNNAQFSISKGNAQR